MIRLDSTTIRSTIRWGTFVAVAICLTAACSLASAEEPIRGSKVTSAASPENEVQDLLYLGSKRPLFLRLRIRIAEKNFLAPLEEYVRELFDSLDENKDQLLDETEAKQIPSAKLLFAAQTNETTFVGKEAKADIAPADGKISPEEFLAFIQGVVGKPFEIQVQETDSRRESLLFNQLDVNGDGALSQSELQNLQPLLRRLDINDDGLLGEFELVGQTEYLAMFSPPTAPVDNSLLNNIRTVLQPIDHSSGISKTVTRLLQRYDKLERQGAARFVQDSRLSAKELGVDPAAIQPYDKNSDGILDKQELATFLEHPHPTAELTIAFGKRRTDDIEFSLNTSQKSESGSELGLSQESPQKLTLVVGGERMHIDGTQGPAPISSRLESSRVSVQQFQSADRDNNDYLDSKEFQFVGLPANLFAVIDQDGNQQIFQQELKKYFNLRDGLARSRIHMTFRREGARLYELLDEDGDSRFSESELRQAFAKIQSWDKDVDDRVQLSELPSEQKVLFSIGPPPGVPGENAPIRNRMKNPGYKPQPTGPIWFQKMDRNRDGKVSRREFLGPLDLFSRLDSSGDGLLDPTEADEAK